jgi:hypothetical protein
MRCLKRFVAREVFRDLRIPRVLVHPFRLNPYTDSGVFVHPAGG